MISLPQSLITSLTDVPGFDEKTFVATHAEGETTVAIRLNPYKCKQDDTAIAELPISYEVPWSVNGFYLNERPAFFLDPLWHSGAYYVQEPSSMSLEFVLRNVCDLSQPLRILDLCAAPGGKSTLLAGLMSPDSLLVSNEVIASRTKILEENIVKWGNPNVIVTQNDAIDFSRMENFFDVILIDAPCSGSGLFRKDPEALNEWSPEQVAWCAKRQKRIVADVLPALKGNGVLIYSTCSFSSEENEDIADYIVRELALENIAVPFKKEWHIVESVSTLTRAKGYRFYPDKLSGEGFFLSCFQRKKDIDVTEKIVKHKRKLPKQVSPLSGNHRQLIDPWMKPTDDLYLFLWKNTMWAVPESIRPDVERLFLQLKIVSAGTNLGKAIRDQFIPDHPLAMSIRAKKDAMINLCREEAVRYLRKEAVSLSETVKGWKLAAYDNHPLGWLKGVGARTNNYYPMNWRIRKKSDT